MAKSNIKISVILPVHNVGPYIGRCIESLRAQLLEGLEFIFVDDCSTDDSMKAVEEWAEQDARVRILRNGENLGSGPSRNRGIEAARGDYLSFIDPDDYVSPDFYQLLYTTAKAHGFPSIVKGTRSMLREGETEAPKSTLPTLNEIIRGKERDGVPLWYSFSYEHQSAIFLRNVALDSGARYGTSRISQDVTFLLRFCSATTQDIVLEDGAVYYYVVRKGSAVRVQSAAMLDYRLHAFKEQVEHLARLAHDDPQTSLRYAARTISYPLAPMGLCIKRLTGDSAVVRHFIEGLQEQLLLLPEAKDIGPESAVIQALVEHGILLAARPFAPAGEKAHASDWPPIVAEWLRFCREASYARTMAQREAASHVRRALFELTSRSELTGDDADFAQALASIRQLLASAGSGVRLLYLDPRLALFMSGGPALGFGLKRRVKSIAKRVLRR